ncbi:hypothetical protein POTOM_060083 [Populus tomentosa]|uniref:Uncharacterized protein n=1 Tax=Populus tomentosa TaxID=118781 RepID=A0A8X8C187_POPTO|nr:hypothetical protein POTOM_060083 [Populus tomentosa]
MPSRRRHPDLVAILHVKRSFDYFCILPPELHFLLQHANTWEDLSISTLVAPNNTLPSLTWRCGHQFPLQTPIFTHCLLWELIITFPVKQHVCRGRRGNMGQWRRLWKTVPGEMHQCSCPENLSSGPNHSGFDEEEEQLLQDKVQAAELSPQSAVVFLNIVSLQHANTPEDLSISTLIAPGNTLPSLNWRCGHQFPLQTPIFTHCLLWELIITFPVKQHVCRGRRGNMGQWCRLWKTVPGEMHQCSCPENLSSGPNHSGFDEEEEERLLQDKVQAVEIKPM